MMRTRKFKRFAAVLDGMGDDLSMGDDFTSRLRACEPVAGCWISIGHPASAELLAGVGYDFAVLDGEHTEMTLEALATVVRAVAAAGTDTVPIVRVASNDPTEVKRVLDLGPVGVMVPSVETAAEAERAVDACTYRPHGRRGVAGYRAAGYGANLQEYVASASEEVLTIVQVESERGVENVEKIAAVDGVDALFIGPVDLSASLDVFGDYDADEMQDAVDRIVDAADEANTPVGTLATSRAEVDVRDDWGVDFLAMGPDLAMLGETARDYLSTYRGRHE
ncbi:aldolase [Halobellus sp. Atlit-38R]|jgi:2-keto-3-deoxy-L-rhamnonate aldolase RhmA|nr:aldolase [Halobellus sp. Atlit-38R]